MKPKGPFPVALSAAVLISALFLAPPASAADGYVSGLDTYPLRDTPQFSAAPVARLRVGTRLSILEKGNGWVKVKSGENQGWMPDSVIGEEAPAVVRLGPVQEKVRKMEAGLEQVSAENADLKERNERMSERVAFLEKELAEVEDMASGARTSRRLQGMALGGGLVLFGWLSGYALASRSGQARQKGKLIID